MSDKKAVFEATPAQKNAINACGGGIIVSAAAGSGKTRVLVQRVIRLLTGDDAVPADRLLILTFTNTAAAEMKMRISQAIDELIEDNPDNDFYRRQQLLLSCADICTIDSFCSKVVRENFFRLGVSRDFRIGTSAELYELSRKIMSDVIEEYYTPPKEGSESYSEKLKTYESFNLLSMLMTDEKLDNDLESGLLEAYDKYTSHAFPDQWLRMCTEQYDPEKKLCDNKTADYLFDSLKPLISKLRACYDSAMEYYGAVEAEMYKKQEKKKAKDNKKNAYDCAMDAYESYGYFLENMEELYTEDKRNFSAAADMIGGFSKIRISYGSSKDENIKYAASTLGAFADIVNGELKPYSCYTEDIFRENNEKLYPVMKCLAEILQKFDKRYFDAKRERRILDFHDLESLVLKLLYRYDESSDSYITTDFAAETAEKYDEIMIDEYQDTNDIQENIFKAISKNEENLFVVGDIKQSIFRFREAKPLLFKKRCETARDYDVKSELFPALIVLDRNFRSRKGIIDSVNYIFGLIMSEKAGEIEYDEKHRLTAGAYYPEKAQPDTELHIVEYRKRSPDGETDDEQDEEDADKIKTEAIYCAKLIRDIVNRGDTVYDSREKRERRVIYSDFCILMRTVKNWAHIYSSELERCGIPVYTDAEFDLLERYEVKAALAYLKVLNNPLSDIDMLAALMCPVFGFTPDELAQIKEVERKSYYRKLSALAHEDKSVNKLAEKCGKFIDTMKRFRELSVTLPTDRLLTEFFESTGFISVMNAMPNGEFRVQNLRKFMNFVSEYEGSVSGGITGFVRHIRYLEETHNGIKVSDSTPVNAVRIMTIHHSKGLEFPICILAGTNSKGKSSSLRVNYHSELGIGLRTMDTEKLLQFNTLQYTAIKRAAELEEKSELLRLLYVALTRPKERLIMLSTVTTDAQEEADASDSSAMTKYRKYLNNIAKKIIYDERTGHILPEVVMNCKTFSEWIIMCALLNGEMKEIRHDACVSGAGEVEYSDSEVILPALVCKTQWKFVHAAEVVRDMKKAVIRDINKTDGGLEQFLHKRFSEKRNDLSTKVPSKVSASMLAHKSSPSLFAAVSKPSFARGERVSPAEKGTATHAFLQYADIKRLYGEIAESGAFEEEKKAVIAQKLMSAAQAELIVENDIINFSKSRLFERMVKAQRLYREYRFTVSIPAKMALIDGDSFSDEEFGDSKSILQGSVDCIIEENDGLVIVDYKTDRVKNAEELEDMYALQLNLYKEAINQIFDKPVKECYIYSLHCGCEILTE